MATKAKQRKNGINENRDAVAQGRQDHEGQHKYDAEERPNTRARISREQAKEASASGVAGWGPIFLTLVFVAGGCVLRWDLAVGVRICAFLKNN